MQYPQVTRPLFKFWRRSLPLWAIFVSGHALASSYRVIEDTPGRLVLEVVTPAHRLDSAAQGVKVHCAGCKGELRPGAPDIPMERFNLISDRENLPQVTLSIQESDVKRIGEGVSPVPHYPSPREAEYRKDDVLYGAASQWQARIAEPSPLRGIPVRGVELPLALWNEKSRELTSLRRMRVTFTFPRPYARAGARLPASFTTAIANPEGGRYLYAPAPRVAAKSARHAAMQSDRFIRITVGDRELEGLQEDGMYEVEYSALAALTSDIAGLPVSHLKIFTGPADSLPAQFKGLPRAGNLRQIPIQVLDRNSNQTFDAGDAILFFAQGTSRWRRVDSVAGPVLFEFTADPYSFENHYYLDFSPGQGMRLESLSRPQTGTPLTSSYAYRRAEKDVETAQCDPSNHKDTETNKEWHWHWKGSCKSGSGDTVLYGNQLSSAQMQALDGYLEDSVLVGLYSHPPERSDWFEPHVQGQVLSLLGDGHEAKGTYFVLRDRLPSNNSFQFDSLVWADNKNKFDGYTLMYRRSHAYGPRAFRIYPTVFGTAVSYRLQNPTGLRVLRIADGVAEAEMAVVSGVFTDSLASHHDAYYYVFRASDHIQPESGKLALESRPASGTAVRNLATGDGVNPEYLILAPQALLAQALKLRDYRKDPARSLPLRTAVVRTEDIYREYSGGRLSPVAIRDFLRFAVHEWSGQGMAQSPLQHVLLFGDGHYDYRNIKGGVAAPVAIQVPTFQFATDWKSIGGMNSDDFFAVLSDSMFYSNAQLDVALGRLPVATAQEAETYLEKVKVFEDPANAGEWRSRVVLAADDVRQRQELDAIPDHTNQTESLGRILQNNEPSIALEKVYLIDYQPNSSWQKPEAAQDLLALINRGAVMVNYVGHGSSDVWADEGLMRSRDALARMDNRGRNMLLNSFSCTVGRFDLLSSEGMSEKFVKADGVGAIAAISATRESYPTQNINLASAIYDRLFPGPSATSPVTLGQAYREGKNEASDSNRNDQKYALLGEPVLLIRRPKLNVALEASPDTLQALDCGEITGKVEGGSGNGFLNIKILGGDISKSYEQGQSADKRGSILFEGTVPYSQGRFSLDYLIPKRIPYGDTTAKILAFAWDASREAEGGEALLDLHVKGTAASGCRDADDGKGPQIVVTGCDVKQTANEDFPAEVALPLPYCLEVQVRDSVGGVMSGDGPDEGTTLEIPGTLEPFHPVARIDELQFKSYKLNLDERTVKPGRHLLKVSSRDGYGNYSQRELRLNLHLDSSLTLVKAYNVPNPLKKGTTTFFFSTVLYADAGEIFQEPTTGATSHEIRIFNQSGKLVKVLENAESGSTRWDGRDAWGNRLANGVYFYEVTARESVNFFNRERRRTSSKRNTLLISR